MPLSQYTADEINAAWYNADEYTMIAQKARKIISRTQRRMMEESQSTIPSRQHRKKNGHRQHYCTRGLEAFIGDNEIGVLIIFIVDHRRFKQQKLHRKASQQSFVHSSIHPSNMPSSSLPRTSSDRHHHVDAMMQQQLQSQQRRQPPRPRAVSFAPKIRVKSIMPLSQYTADEINAAWYNADEYTMIAQKARKIISRTQRHMMEESRSTILSRQHRKNGHRQHYCTRGLEAFIGDGAEKKRSIRQQAYRIVLDSHHHPFHDDFMIAEQYQLVSLQCQIEACVRGRNDYEKARSYASSNSSFSSHDRTQRRRNHGPTPTKKNEGIVSSPQTSISPLPKFSLPSARAA
eukprot:CAMPEP_0119571144 /NCGR_PEP_ID=MMETSP1352-20130426/43972_1 /TAXON_ID=265584 /ORGANISM="Stauroneis constricta, Strain CCMP1120" /LENGTH=345 /DNA_ID=CAMNT_0007620823 /DNA_START=188 /DNA_END=1222 /DNA_ORIENTATION=-